MARAEIYIEDTDDGLVAVKVKYIGGTDPKSNAHQLANMLRAHCDAIMAQRSEPEMVTSSAIDALIPHREIALQTS